MDFFLALSIDESPSGYAMNVLFQTYFPVMNNAVLLAMQHACSVLDLCVSCVFVRWKAYYYRENSARSYMYI